MTLVTKYLVHYKTLSNDCERSAEIEIQHFEKNGIVYNIAALKSKIPSYSLLGEIKALSTYENPDYIFSELESERNKEYEIKENKQIKTTKKMLATKLANKSGWRERYAGACFKATGKVLTSYPDVTTANGMKSAIESYCDWKGNWFIRVNVFATEITTKDIPSIGGFSIKGTTAKAPSMTKRGTADTLGAINGYPVCFEVKIGNDKPSEFQLGQKKLIENNITNGYYIFVSSIDEFFYYYDIFANAPSIPRLAVPNLVR